MTDTNVKVLIVEDEEPIRKFINLNLQAAGFEVLEAGSGEMALTLLGDFTPEVIVLDIMLPGIDGLQVCSRVRETMPGAIIIMLTAKGQDMDKIMGLDLGADDYMVKPFNPMELIARIKAILRRAERITDRKVEEINFDCLSLNLKSNKCFKQETEIELTPTEFAMLKMFMENPGKAFTRDEVLDLIWGEDYFGDTKTVDVHVRRLREKVEDNPSKPGFIETVWGYGYRWRGEK